tara:strand:- start:9140 stop:9334 length:195 start_codon:yes stop_codon:yes gene_type:complete
MESCNGAEGNGEARLVAKVRSDGAWVGQLQRLGEDREGQLQWTGKVRADSTRCNGGAKGLGTMW